MTQKWLEHLQIDPTPALLEGDDLALAYFARRDLVDEPVAPVETLWELQAAVRLVAKQQPDGSWKYPGKISKSGIYQNYALLETYRNLRTLVGKYGFNRSHPALEKAAEYVFTCQTIEGDVRGIIGNQYMPYYHGVILELLIKAGYENDPRTITGLEWLLTMRQEDGGWIVPVQAIPSRERTPGFWTGPPVSPERSKPHAHLATGMVLRAFAAHPDYLSREEVIAAGVCLKGRFFKGDKYNDRKAPSYWLKFQYPFWWSSLLTALDSLSRLGFDPQDVDIEKGLEWFIQNQQAAGLWPTGYDSGQKAEENRRWVGLAVCRMMKQYYQGA
jgi:hypothetical protein